MSYGTSRVDCLILAGGQGTRALPLSVQIPKPLFPVLNEPILLHVIEAVQRCRNIARIGVTLPFEHRTIETLLAQRAPDVEWLYEPAGLGTAGSVTWNKQWITSGSVVVLHADRLTTVCLETLIQRHVDASADVTLAAFPVHSGIWTGDTLSQQDGWVRNYHMFDDIDRSNGELGWTGVSVVRSSCLPTAVPSRLDLARDLVKPLVDAGVVAVSLFVAAEVQDFGVLREFHHVAQAPRLMELGVMPRGSEVAAGIWSETLLDDGLIGRMDGFVVVGQGVHLGAECTLSGPVVIGHGAHIGARAHVGGAVILPGARVPAGSSVVHQTYHDCPSILLEQMQRLCGLH